MYLVSWNVNSLRSAEPKFLEFIEKYSPDVVMIQELRAFPDQLSFFLKAIPGYQALFNPSPKPGYSGTAIYYKDTLKIDEISNRTGNEILDSEGRVIYIRTGKHYIFNFYTPNGSSSFERLQFKLKYYEEIIKHCRKLIGEGNSIILGGDLNVAPTPLDLYAPSQNMRHSGFLPEERDWFAKMENLGFVDTFRLFQKAGGYYSWWHLRDPKRAANRGWRFDYFLVTQDLKDKIKKAEILREVYGSDHCPVTIEIA